MVTFVEEIVLSDNDSLIGDPTNKLYFARNPSSKKLVTITGSNVTIKNCVFEWNMQEWKQYSKLIGFASFSRIKNITIENCDFINTTTTTPNGKDCWCVNFTNPGGLEGVIVKNCRSFWDFCQLTAGGKCQPGSGIYDINILNNKAYGGRNNTIAVTGWDDMSMENITLDGNVCYDVLNIGTFIGKDGNGSNKPPLRHMRNIRIKNHRVHLGMNNKEFKQPILIKAYCNTPAQDIFLENCYIDNSLTDPTLNPRSVVIKGDSSDGEQQVRTRNMKYVGVKDNVIRLSYLDEDM